MDHCREHHSESGRDDFEGIRWTNSKKRNWRSRDGIFSRAAVRESAARRSPRCSILRLFAAGGLTGLPHFPPTAKRVIYLHQSGAPRRSICSITSPSWIRLHGTELPASVRNGQRITGMTSGQSFVPGRALHLQVRAARPVRRVVQRTAAAHCEDCRRDHRSCAR